jgi:hypothetical protein
MLRKATTELEQLGGKRETAPEQCQYLLKISVAFQEVVNSALSANYVGSDWFDRHQELRFATDVVNRNEALAKTLETYGHLYQFAIPSELDSDDGDDEGLDTVTYEKEPKNTLSLRCKDDFEGLQDLINGIDSKFKEGVGDIMSWLTRVYQTSRGFELGTFDSSLLAMTMKTQSCNWEVISFGYIKDIICMAHKFIQVLLGLVCPDKRVLDGLLSVLTDELFAKYQMALTQVRFLLDVERYGTPSTLDHYFNDNLQKR